MFYKRFKNVKKPIFFLNTSFPCSFFGKLTLHKSQSDDLLPNNCYVQGFGLVIASPTFALPICILKKTTIAPVIFILKNTTIASPTIALPTCILKKNDNCSGDIYSKKTKIAPLTIAPPDVYSEMVPNNDYWTFSLLNQRKYRIFLSTLYNRIRKLVNRSVYIGYLN